MAARLYLVAGKVTDSVTLGFLPAALRLGLDVVVFTDRPAEHARAYEPVGPVRIVECDVTDFREIIARIDRIDEPPGAVFTNSDHLQAPVALAAAYFGLPGKDWRAATRTKNKALMRRHLAALDPVFSAPAEAVPLDAPFPLVLKPCQGVASEDVFMVYDADELAVRVAEIRTRRADPLVVEEYLPGQLHTLETLGDGAELHVLGSFRTTISAPPYFMEERLEWLPPPPESEQVLAQLAALGVGFGACHTEFVVHEGRARLIEVNYRIIGDHGDLLLADLLDTPIFERVLGVHLGEPLGPPPRARAAALLDNVVADRAGRIAEAPGSMELTDGAVRVTYRAQRSPGDEITITHTNRDYLGIIQAVGPDHAALEKATAHFRAAHTWEIQ